MIDIIYTTIFLLYNYTERQVLTIKLDSYPNAMNFPRLTLYGLTMLLEHQGTLKIQLSPSIFNNYCTQA